MARLKSGLLFGPLVPIAKDMLSNATIREFIAEIIGTFCLLIGGFTSHVVYKAKGGEMDVYGVAFCFGVGGMIGISATMDVSGAHLNPAVTTALASVGRLPWFKVFHYILAQYIGAFVAASATFAIGFDAIDYFDPNVTQHGSSVYTTFPGRGVGLLAAFIDQVLSTGFLTFAVVSVDGSKLPRCSHPVYFMLVITGIVIAFNYNAGAILNPARDLAPRMFTFFIGYGAEVFKPLNYQYWWLVGVVAPHLGGILGVWCYVLFLDPDSVTIRDEPLIPPSSSAPPLPPLPPLMQLAPTKSKPSFAVIPPSPTTIKEQIPLVNVQPS